MFLSDFDKLPTASKTEFEVFPKVVSSYIDNDRVSTATRIKPEFRVTSKWFMGNAVFRGGHRISPPPSSLFHVCPYYRLHTKYGLYYHRVDECCPCRCNCSWPLDNQTIMPFGTLLTVIFNHFDAPLHCFYSWKAGSITFASIKLMKLSNLHSTASIFSLSVC